MLLDPGLNLTLRPMVYPQFYEMYRNAIKNTWTVEEVDFSIDMQDLKKLTEAERHMLHRLVAFFATGDSIVSHNLVLNLYQHLNSPEARMYLSRQLYEEALHVQFYLTLLDSYIPDQVARQEAFQAVENIPSIKAKADFCFRWMRPESTKKDFILTLICFATCVEGLFFFAAFAYVYFLRSRGLFPGLASGTNWVFRDESCHMNFAFEALKIIKDEEPELFDADMEARIRNMMMEAVEVEGQFAEDLLGQGIPGLSSRDMKQYLQYIADQRLQNLGLKPQYNVKNPLPFMELQDVQELTNFFERRVSAYAIIGGNASEVNFDEQF